MFVEKTSFQLFSHLCVFPKHSSARNGTPYQKLILAREKVVLRAEAFSALWDFFEKNSKLDLLFFCREKSGFRV